MIGELGESATRLIVDVMFDQLQLRTFDYTLRNAKPIRVLMNDNVVRIDDMRFVGDGTELDVTGIVDLNARRVAGLARGHRQPRHPAGVLSQHPQLGQRHS